MGLGLKKSDGQTENREFVKSGDDRLIIGEQGGDSFQFCIQPFSMSLTRIAGSSGLGNFTNPKHRIMKDGGSGVKKKEGLTNPVY